MIKKILNRSEFVKKVYATFFKKEPSSANILAELINEYGLESYAEVGVWKGGTLKKVLKLCPGLKRVFVVDPYKVANGENDPAHIYENSQEYFDKVYDKLVSSIDDKRVIFMRHSSVEAAKEFDDDGVDIVFIDAAHDYVNVKNDIEAWTPKAKHIVSGHDFCDRYNNDVVRAVLEKFGANVNLGEDKVWWVIK